jgi:LacI family transcriptional regulator
VENGRQRRPTVADVARTARVSVATAGRALGGYGYVRPETRARVQAAAQALGYSPNVVARSMRSGGTRSIGFVGSDIANPFFAEAMRGICDVANEEGYEAILTNSDERLDLEQLAVRTLLEKQVDGLVVAPSSVTQFGHLASARAQGVPVVLLDRHLPQLDCDSVVIDNQAAAHNAVTHLVGLGHRRIGLLASINAAEQPRIVPVESSRRLTAEGAGRPSVERIRGYLDALAEHQAPVSQDTMKYILSGHPGQADVPARELIGFRQRPSAVFATDNASTRSIFLAAKSEGIPDELSLVGFDDLDWTTMVDPPISVVAQSPLRMGRVAAERLFARIKGDEQPGQRDRTGDRAADLGQHWQAARFAADRLTSRQQVKCCLFNAGLGHQDQAGGGTERDEAVQRRHPGDPSGEARIGQRGDHALRHAARAAGLVDNEHPPGDVSLPQQVAGWQRRQPAQV